MKPIVVVVIYRHPASSLPKFIEGFKDLNVFLATLDYEMIMFGDFNLDLLKHDNTFDTNKLKFKNVCVEFYWWQRMIGPTFQKNSLLDHLYTKDCNKYAVSGHAGSDHDLCYVIRKQQKVEIPTKVILYRTYRNIDWIIFQKDIESFKWDNTNQVCFSNEQIDNMFWTLNNFVMNKLDEVAPLKSMRVKVKVSPWFTNKVNELCILRNLARNKAMKSNEKND